jgi:hypothetical protein
MKTTKTKNLLLGIAIGIGTSFATVAQNVPNYVPTNGLAAWYSFTGNANDDSGNGNNGIPNGATLTSGKAGITNTAYLFNGINNTIDLSNPFLGGTQVNSFTFHALINLNSLVNSSTIWNKDLFWGETIFEVQNTGDIRFWWTNNITGNKYSIIYSQQNIIQTGIWYDIVVVFQNSTGQIYLNGNPLTTNLLWVAQGGATLSTSQIESQCNFAQNPNTSKFGQRISGGSPTDFFNGKIDEFGIWNRALTQQEISDLYNAVNCANNTTITPQINSTTIGSTASFNVITSDTNPSYIWQSDLGQGFQTLNNYGNYSGVNTSTLNIANVQLANHNQPIRAISTSGNCVDTSNVAYINIADTCITTVYDTVTTYISVTDTLFINVNTVGLNNNTIINTIKVFPNPANSHLNLDFGNFNSLNGYSIKIYNSLSQVIYNQQITQQSETIDLGTFGGNGVYFLHVINAQNNTVEIRKIVLQ